MNIEVHDKFVIITTFLFSNTKIETEVLKNIKIIQKRKGKRFQYRHFSVFIFTLQA